jgi:hypothetical protein
MAEKSQIGADAMVPQDPAQALMQPWPGLLIAALVLAGLVSPLITLLGAAGALAVADQDQGIVLAGAGLMHVILGMTLLAGF